MKKHIVGKRQAEEEKFLFSQQGRDSSCHLNSWLNLKLLYALRSNGELKLNDKLKLDEKAWKSNEQWIGVTYPLVVAWQKALAKLTITENKFAEYQQKLVDEGIHFEGIFTESQKAYHQAALNPLQNLQRFLFTPFNFIDSTDFPEALYKSLPIFSDGSLAYIYDSVLDKYEELNELKVGGKTLKCFNLEDKTIFLPILNKHFQLSASQCEYLRLPDKVELKVDKLRSYESKYKYGYSFMFLPEQAKERVYYHAGLYQLILFALGLDRNNNVIDEKHELYSAYQVFVAEIKSDPDNSWGFNIFSKENFLEYHLANIFKKNAELKQKAIATMGFIANAWEHYVKLDELFDSADLAVRQSLKSRKQCLPADDQILAYSFSMSLRLLWASAISQKTLRSFMEVPKQLLALTRLPGFPKAKEVIAAAYTEVEIVSKDSTKVSVDEQKIDKASTNFVKVWQEVYPKLLQVVGENRDLVSFNGHGAIVSFATDILAEQQKMKFNNPAVIADLKFGIIDSLYANVTEPFYQNDEEIKVGTD